MGPIMTTPEDRSSFEIAVRNDFAFLQTKYGMKVTASEARGIRFESDVRFVSVCWGRTSYEITEEIGRWLLLDGKIVEDRFFLQNLVALVGKTELLPRAVSTTSEHAAAAFVKKFAVLTDE